MSSPVCITGATGYLGRALSSSLISRGHAVRALVRPGGAARVAAGVDVRELDVFDVDALAAALAGGGTVVHLIGTPHPNPRKAAEFQRVDLGSARVCAAAAARARVAHVVYVSVAQPAPMMHAYVAARAAAEAAFVASGVAATFVRPWYVLGPGHRWPYLLLPVYFVAERVPGTREDARRLGLVTLAQMTRALVAAVEAPPPGGEARIVDVPAIRAAAPGA
ncbi:MAG TPA: NAD(P)H-binding protein [Steroidobacteraceae bacterium]|nr:NAD(P)H-binding protein [Steroidobacteraceae bacterium]